MFKAVSQVRAKTCCLSLELSGPSISAQGWSHLSSADLSELQDSPSSALPLEMTGLCANGPGQQLSEVSDT